MIRPCIQADFDAICAIVNDATQAYRGVIPADRWHEPYMSREELAHEIASGVRFWGYALPPLHSEGERAGTPLPSEGEVAAAPAAAGEGAPGAIPRPPGEDPHPSPLPQKGEGPGVLLGVMGIQDVQDVSLIRHAYVRTACRNQGIGGKLLAHLRTLTDRPILIGTWAAAAWAVRFYEKHGFRQVTPAQKDRLLRTYWSIPDRQIETSVVLADERWFAAGSA
jgi:GNAT superfamily N-acetyltransferase